MRCLIYAKPWFASSPGILSASESRSVVPAPRNDEFCVTIYFVKYIKFFIILSLVFSSYSSFAISITDRGNPRTLTILPATDSTGANLSSPIQYRLARLFQQTRRFYVNVSSFILPGFTTAHLTRAFEGLSSDVISFSYLEPERIAVFLFDVSQPGKFIVSSQRLIQIPGQPLARSEIDGKLVQGFQEVMANYLEKKFQPLPDAAAQGEDTDDEEARDRIQQSEEARRLFRELTPLSESRFYLGANIGMARYSANGSSASTVNLGGFGGSRLFSRLFTEVGVNLFSYAMGYLDLRYKLPIAEKFVSLTTSFGGAYNLGLVSENKGFDPTYLKTGQIFFGPGISFEVPLLGANIRGELKYYMGGAGVLMGTYGVSYAL